MCTGNKLRRASDQVLIKRNQERSELVHLRKGYAQAIEATKAAEAESKRYADRCMRLTATADTAILWMMFALFVATLSLGFMVHAL